MSRSVTLAGYCVLATAIVAYQVAGLVRRRTPTLGQAVEPLRRSLPGRLVLLALWMWVGWHLFVRGDWG